MVQLKTFMDFAVLGIIEPEHIDDFVEAWHDSKQPDGPLTDFLGMIDEQYAKWVADPNCLEAMIAEARTPEQEMISILFKGLATYADPEFYFAISVMADHPAGGFADDWDEHHGDPDMPGPRAGKHAREVLALALGRPYPEPED